MQSQNDSIINKDMSFCILSEDKMFRIAKGYSSVSKTIRLSEEKAEYLEKLAAENMISFNKLVNQCIEFALKNLYCEKPQEDEE